MLVSRPLSQWTSLCVHVKESGVRTPTCLSQLSETRQQPNDCITAETSKRYKLYGSVKRLTSSCYTWMLQLVHKSQRHIPYVHCSCFSEHVSEPAVTARLEITRLVYVALYLVTTSDSAGLVLILSRVFMS